MAEHKRLTIMKALCAHLEGINGIAPYAHDLRGKIYRGRNTYGTNFELPMVSILEGKATDYGVYADDAETVRKDTWILLVQGWVEDDVTNPTDPAYGLLADVEMRLSDITATVNGQPKYAGIYLLGGLISSLTLAQPVVRPPEDNLSTKAFFYLPVMVGLKSDTTNPRGGR